MVTKLGGSLNVELAGGGHQGEDKILVLSACSEGIPHLKNLNRKTDVNQKCNEKYENSAVAKVFNIVDSKIKGWFTSWFPDVNYEH